MGGQEKERDFSDFVLYPLVHREFPRGESGNFFISILSLLCNFSKDPLSLFSLCPYLSEMDFCNSPV